MSTMKTTVPPYVECPDYRSQSFDRSSGDCSCGGRHSLFVTHGRRERRDGRESDRTQAPYGVTYRDTDGKVRHVRVLAGTAEEASQHAQRSVVGFARLERVFLTTRDPHRTPEQS